MPDAELGNLLAKARAFNAAHQITGVLLYHDEQFVQVMEGEEATIRGLYEGICRDSRHRAVVKLADKPIEHRSFGDWSMAFRPVAAKAFATLEGYADPDRLARAGESGDEADALLAQIVQLTFHEGAVA
jgi:hypothetical protein